MTMQFSIFDDDDTLGDAASYGYGNLLRDVELRIDGTFQNPMGSTIWYNDANAAGIKSHLESKGWIIEQISNVSNSYFPQVYGFNYFVHAVVGSSYTDRVVQDQIRRDLAGFFNVTGVSIVSAPYQPTSSAITAANNNSSQLAPPPKANYGSPLPSATPNTGGSDWDLDFWSALGLSAPVALVGGGLLLMLLLRK